MNKTELVAAIAKKTELSKKDAEKALKAFTDVVAEELKVRRSSQQDSELLKYLKELQEKEETLAAEKLCILQLLKHLNSKQEKL